MALDLNAIIAQLTEGGPVTQVSGTESGGVSGSLRVSTNAGDENLLADLIKQAALLNQQSAERADVGAELLAGSQSIAGAQGDNLDKQAQLSYDVALTRGQGELEAQQARTKLANAYGTNAAAQGNVVVDLAESTRETARKFLEAQSKVSKIEANSDLLGNPGGWLVDLLVGGEFRARRDALADEFDAKIKIANALNASTQQGAQTQNAIAETLNAASIANTAELAALQKTNEAYQARIEANRYGIATLELLNRTGAEQFNRNFQIYQATRQEEQFAIMRREAEERRKAAKKDEQYFQDAMDRINAYNSQFGLPPVNIEFVTRNLEKSNPVGEKLRAAELAGWHLQNQGGDPTGVLGLTPADAYQAINRDNLQTPESWKPSLELLEQANRILLEQQAQTVKAKKDPMGNEIPTDMGFTSGTFKTPEGVKLAFNKVVEQLSRQAMAEIRHGTGNPYQAPPLEVVLASESPTARALKESKFAQTVLADLRTAEVADPAPELLIQTGLEHVNRGNLTLAELNDGVGAYYQEAVALKNALGGFGVTNVFGANSYNVSIDSLVGERVRVKDPEKPSIFDRVFGSDAAGAQYDPFTRDVMIRKELTAPKRIFNLLDPQDRTTALTLVASQRKAQELLKAMKEGR